MQEVSPLKAATSHRTEISSALNLEKAFGHIPIEKIKSQMIYQYLDARSKIAPVRANREIALMSHMFTKGIRWGACEYNPALRIEKNKEIPRKRYVTDEEFIAFKRICPEWLQHYCDLKYLTALRQTDMLHLEWRNISQSGISIRISKTQQEVLIKTSESLTNVLNRIRQNKNTIGSMFIFHNRKGQKYTLDGFRAIFYRYMRNAVSSGVLAEPFQEKDIRAKSASDSISLEDASRLLDHSDARVTRKHYMRKAKIINPLF